MVGAVVSGEVITIELRLPVSISVDPPSFTDVAKRLNQYVHADPGFTILLMVTTIFAPAGAVSLSITIIC